MPDTITINRAPVLTLWAAVVAERLGFRWDEALTLGRAVAGISAYRKGLSPGLFEPTPSAIREHRRAAEKKMLRVNLLNRAIPAMNTPEGLRAYSKLKPIEPRRVASIWTADSAIDWKT